MDKETEKYTKEHFPHLKFHKNWELDADLMFKLGEISAMVETLAALPLDPAVQGGLMRVALIKGAMATTAIEGNTLSEFEIEKILGGQELPESRKYQEIEVKNVIEAMNGIAKETLENNTKAFITNAQILNFHKAIGKELGDNFGTIPGKYRDSNVVVGRYRAPEYKHVRRLMDELVSWLRKEFSYSTDCRQEFTKAIVESVVAHVYIAWIHPFGDGNGRTARLLEFYILLRCGLPITCSHVLSNYYNQTRPKYYRLLEHCRQEQDLTPFLEYAILGLRDGVLGVLKIVQEHQMENTWKNYVYKSMSDEMKINSKTRDRMRNLVLGMKIDRVYKKGDLIAITPSTLQAYAKISESSYDRDLKRLLKMELIVIDGNEYKANYMRLLSTRLPKRVIY